MKVLQVGIDRKKNRINVQDTLEWNLDYRFEANEPFILKRDRNAFFNFTYEGQQKLAIPYTTETTATDGVSPELIYRYGDRLVSEYAQRAIAAGFFRLPETAAQHVLLTDGEHTYEYGNDYYIAFETNANGVLQDEIVFLKDIGQGKEFTLHLALVPSIGNGTKTIETRFPFGELDYVFFITLDGKIEKIVLLVERGINRLDIEIERCVSDYVAGKPGALEFLKTYFRQNHHLYNVGDLINRLEKYRHLDIEVDGFIDSLKHMYFGGIDNTLSDPVFLLDHLSDFFAQKGNEKSFSFLMRILFGKECSLFYPKEMVLSPSQSRMYSKRYMVIEQADVLQANGYGALLLSKENIPSFTALQADERNLLVGKIIVGETSGAKAYIVDMVAYEDDYVFEVDDVRGEFLPWERIVFDGESSTPFFIVPVSIGMKIVEAGSGYAIGDRIIGPNGMMGLVTATDRHGAVLSAKQVSHGKRVLETDTLKIERKNFGRDAVIQPLTSTIVTYRGDINRNTLNGVYDPVNAGAMESTNGILNYAHIQDGYYWQQFSYELRSDVPYTLYEKTFRRVIHPAGTKDFGLHDLGHSKLTFPVSMNYIGRDFELLGNERAVLRNERSTPTLYHNGKSIMQIPAYQPLFDGDNLISRPTLENRFIDPLEPFKWERGENSVITDTSILNGFNATRFSGKLWQRNILFGANENVEVKYLVEGNDIITLEFHDTSSGNWCVFKAYPDRGEVHMVLDHGLASAFARAEIALTEEYGVPLYALRFLLTATAAMSIDAGIETENAVLYGSFVPMGSFGFDTFKSGLLLNGTTAEDRNFIDVTGDQMTLTCNVFAETGATDTIFTLYDAANTIIKQISFGNQDIYGNEKFVVSFDNLTLQLAYASSGAFYEELLTNPVATVEIHQVKGGERTIRNLKVMNTYCGNRITLF